MQSRHRPIPGVILCLVLALVVGLWLQRQWRVVPAVRLLPRGTLAWVEVPQIREARARYASTATAKILREPEVRPMLEAALRVLQDRLPESRDGMRMLGEWLRLLSFADGEVFVAVTDVSISPRLDVGVLAGVQLAPRHAFQAMDWGDEMLGSWRVKYPLAQVETRTAGGIEYQAWNPKPGVVVAFGRIGRTLLFSYGEQPLREALERYAGERDDLLAGSKDDAMLLSRTKGVDGWVYLNPKALLDGFKTLLSLQPTLRDSLDSGIPVQWALATVTFKEGGVEENLWMRLQEAGGGKDGGLLRICNGCTLAAVDAEVHAYGVMGMDPVPWVEQISKGLEGPGGELARKQLGDVWKGSGWEHIHWKEDILAQLGPEFAVAGGWKEGQLTPTGVLILEVKQDRKLKGPMDGLEKIFMTLHRQWGPKATLESLRGPGGVRMCALRHPDTQGWLSPCFAMTDRLLILSPNLAGLEASLKALMRVKPGLASTPMFQEVMARVPKDRCQMLYCDEKRLFERAYNAGSAVTALWDHAAAIRMPRTPAISQHLFPGVWTVLMEGGEYRMTSFGPVGVSSCLAAAGAVLETGTSRSP